jgi:hypothetical protein
MNGALVVMVVRDFNLSRVRPGEELGRGVAVRDTTEIERKRFFVTRTPP